jgi:NitT/TauT family transport system permease protein
LPTPDAAGTGTDTDADVEARVLAVEAAAVRRADRRDRAVTGARRVVLVVGAILAMAGLYAGYKALGRALGDPWSTWPLVGGWLPATDDLILPPLSRIAGSLLEPVQRGSEEVLAVLILRSAAFTLRSAAAGFLAGLVIGLVMAIVLLRSRTLEKGLLPYVVASQTVPLVAIAPIVVIWGRGNLGWLPFAWQDWMSVAVIATYLTFFPVVVNGLRGLQSPSPEALELMDSYAATRRQTLWRLRFPAALPYLFPALRLAATASVVGAIVGEISAGVRGGLGRLILDFAGRYTTGPQRLYAAVLGAALLGIVVVGIIGLVERMVLGGPSEVEA